MSITHDDANPAASTPCCRQRDAPAGDSNVAPAHLLPPSPLLVMEIRTGCTPAGAACARSCAWGVNSRSKLGTPDQLSHSHRNASVFADRQAAYPTCMQMQQPHLHQHEHQQQHAFPHVHIHAPPPPFLLQVAGHAASADGSGGFRTHRRQRSSEGEQQLLHALSAPMTNASCAASSLQATVLKPLPPHAKSTRERHWYERLEQLRRQARRLAAGSDEALPDEWTSVCRCQRLDGETTDATVHDAAPIVVHPATGKSRYLAAIREWLSFFPRSYGTIALAAADASSPPSAPHAASVSVDLSAPPASALPVFLHLVDVTASYSHPSLLDVKMGTHSWDPFALAEALEQIGGGTGSVETATAAAQAALAKVSREDAKCAAQTINGYRVCGARVWRPAAQDADTGAFSPASSDAPGAYAVYDKQWGRAIPVERAAEPFWIFLGHTDESSAKSAETITPLALRNARAVLPLFIQRLRTLLHLCSRAPLWRFYASSILLSYELLPPSDGVSMPGVRADLHLIDFGHAYPIARPLPLLSASLPSYAADVKSRVCAQCARPVAVEDRNYMHGARSLLGVLEGMLRTSQKAEVADD